MDYNITSLLYLACAMNKLRSTDANEGFRSFQLHGAKGYLSAYGVKSISKGGLIKKSRVNKKPYITLNGEDETGSFKTNLFFSKNSEIAFAKKTHITEAELFSCSIAEYEMQMPDGTWETRVKLSQEIPDEEIVLSF
jgi:hypothetical protein